MTVINPNSISGITSITLPSGGDNVLTIHTNDGVERFRIDSSGNVKVGSAATISPDGDVFFTGVTTATTFTGTHSGSGANLTSLPAAQLSGTLPAISAANLTNIPAANVTGTLPSLTAANLTNIPAANLVGVCTSGLTKTGGFGKIVQVLQTTKTDTFSTTSTSQVDITGFSVTITPTSSSNKVLVSGTLVAGYSTVNAYALRFYMMRDSTAICIHDTAGNRSRCTFGTQGVTQSDTTLSFPFEFLDSPNTTSATTYKIQAQSENPQTIYINRSVETDGDQSITPRMVSTITVTEIAA